MSPSQNKSGRKPLVNFAANLLPWQQKKPSIVQYVEKAKYVGGGTIERKWPRSDEYAESYITNFALKATLLSAASALLFSSVNCTANICNNINAIRKTAAVTAIVTAIVTASVTTVFSGVALLEGLSLGTFLSLAQRKKRGKDAAESLFDGVVTDDGLLNGTKLLTAMQNFYATTQAIKAFYPGVKTKTSSADDQYVIADPAAISYVENGDAAIGSILSLFNGDKSNILTEAEAKLRYYNNLANDKDKEQYFPDLTAQFTDPKFVDALALAIFNGDNHQGLVKALARYGDKDELHTTMISLCANASVFIDVANKLRERIPDSLDLKIIMRKPWLEHRRSALIKAYPDIAQGFGLDLRPDADIDAVIDAVNAAFAALNLSGVVDLPSKANDDNPEDRLEAQFAALETGTAAARAALNPQQQATIARLEQVVDEGRELR
jgi:hypothetical protein